MSSASRMRPLEISRKESQRFSRSDAICELIRMLPPGVSIYSLSRSRIWLRATTSSPAVGSSSSSTFGRWLMAAITRIRAFMPVENVSMALSDGMANRFTRASKYAGSNCV